MSDAENYEFIKKIFVPEKNYFPLQLNIYSNTIDVDFSTGYVTPQ